jgi:hypothetical protein
VEGAINNVPWVNTLYWSYSGAAPGAGDLVTFCNALFTTWGTELGPLQAPGNQLLKVTAVDLSGPLGATGESTLALVNGTNAGAGELPSSSALLIHKGVGRRYRGGHPRTYLAVGTGADLDSPQQWDGAIVTSATNAYAAMHTAMIGVTSGATTLLTETVVSYTDKTTNPIAPYRRVVPLALPVTSANGEPAVASQRGRLR